MRIADVCSLRMTVLAGACCVLAACGEGQSATAPPAPPAPTPAGQAASRASPYKLDAGPWSAEAADEFSLRDAKRGKDLPVRVIYPLAKPGQPAPAARFPVIVFSHGAGGGPETCFAIGRHWATHGYVSLMPTHADSFSLPLSAGEKADNGTGVLRDRLSAVYYDPRAWENRARDLSQCLDQLAEIERRIPALKDRLDVERLAAGGHSIGSTTAALVGGATVEAPRDLAATATAPARRLSFRDERVRAVLMMSPQGTGILGLTRTSWETMPMPVMWVAGSRDPGPFGQEPRWRTEPFRFAKPGDKYGLFIQNASHYSYGGRLTEPITQEQANYLIGRGANGRDAVFDPNHERHIYDFVKVVTTAFWDAYLKDDADAKTYLKGDDLSRWTRGAVEVTRK